MPTAKTKPKNKAKRDIEAHYPRRQFVQKLRRLADAIEAGDAFAIQLVGERVKVPANTTFNIEHERTGWVEEIEFQVRWSMKPAKAK
jgi:amphi-Trp domain-containing protein